METLLLTTILAKQLKTNNMREEILSIASDLREGFITTNEAKEQLLVLFGVSASCRCDCVIPKPKDPYHDLEEDICDQCDDSPCTCLDYDDEDDDPFSDPISASCTCGAYKWSTKLGKWLHVSDCCC